MNRHDAIHAIGAMLAHYFHGMQSGHPPAEGNEAYYRVLLALTARRWLRGDYTA